MTSDSPTSLAPVVEVRHLFKTFGQFHALDDVSLSIGAGEVFGYIGPNGAGKTTTMKILVGLITDFQGSIQLDGYPIPQRLGEAHRLLGYLPQSVAFQEWRTVDQALLTFGRLSGLTGRQLERRIPALLDLLSLSDVRHKKISQLSGGMTQKVGLAQALLHEPKLLVLDEPLGGLDPLSRYQLKEIVSMLAKNGTTILFSSHILSDVQDVADRIGILSRGRLIQVGTLDELKTRLTPEQAVEVVLSSATDQWGHFRALRNVEYVEQPIPGKILLHLRPGADADVVINDLINTIARLNIRVRGVTLLSPSLDEIYFRYLQQGGGSV